MKKSILGIIAFLGLYLFSTGISYAVFSYVIEPPKLDFMSNEKQEEEVKGEEKKTDLKQILEVTGEKTEVCPINGQLFTEVEKQAWEKRRPLLVMVENHPDSRPQSGLSSADVVYETVSEGGITRFMPVFYCDAQSHEAIIGPIRSARTYFIDWASEYGDYPLYAHVGGANCNHGCPGGYSKADALGQLEQYGWVSYEGNDLNQFAIGYPTFWRDYERLGRNVATEHTMYSTTERLWNVGKSRGWEYEDSEGNTWDEDFVSWKFIEKNFEVGDSKVINYDFWENSPAGDHSVKWQFDTEEKVYKRFLAEEPQKDLNTDEQLKVSNVVVMYSVESNANDNYENNAHLLYAVIGKGDAVIFRNGQSEEGSWVKKTRTSRTIFYDSSNREIEFVPGKIWISNLAVGNESLDY